MSTSSSASAQRMQKIIESSFRSDEEKVNAIMSEINSRLLNYEEPFNNLKQFVPAITVIAPVPKYEGFDTSVMYSQLDKNRASYLARKPVDLKYKLGRTGGKLSCFTNKETLSHDIYFLIIVGLIFNSHINKTITKAPRPVKDILSMLKEKYDIQDGGTSLGSTVITLPRITRAFPLISVKCFHNKSVKEVVRYDTFPSCSKPETHAICCPFLQSVCPFTLKAESNFHPAMLWVQIKLDDIIHRQNGKTTSVNNILRYYRASYQSKATPEDDRLKLFSQLGIIIQEDTGSGQNWKLTDSSAQLAANCLSELGNMRKEDENHALLMKLAKSGEF